MTSLGSLRQKPSSFEIILNVCKSPYLPRFQVIEIEALSIRKNVTSTIKVVSLWKGKSCFEGEEFEGKFAGEEFKSKFPLLNKANLFPRIFEAIPGTLIRFETL